MARPGAPTRRGLVHGARGGDHGREARAPVLVPYSYEDWGECTGRKTRAGWEMALELAERNCKPAECDEELLAHADGSCIRRRCCKETLYRNRQGPKQELEKKVLRPDGGRIGWGFVIVRIAPTRGIYGPRRYHTSKARWRSCGPTGGTCENDAINQKTANIKGELIATMGLHRLLAGRVFFDLRTYCGR